MHLRVPPDPSSELDLCRGILGGGSKERERVNIGNVTLEMHLIMKSLVSVDHSV